MEAVILTLDAGVFDHGASVGLQAGHGAADVGVYFDNLFDGRCLEEGGGYAFFDAEEDAMGGGDLEKGLSVGCEDRRKGISCVPTPIAVEPSLIASREYSTWKRRPSGEKVLFGSSGPCQLRRVEKSAYFMPRSAGYISWWMRWWKLA